ncbi:hypothetical protein DV737_g2055, partial [Chaetothyriales sp. CBS 132003]
MPAMAMISSANGSAAASTPSKPARPFPPKPRALKRSIHETAPIAIPASPVKRSRVHSGSLDPLVVKEQVRRAVERHRYGNDESYDAVRALFTTPADDRRAPSTRRLRVHLQALLSNVALLSKDCSSLVNAVVYSEWIGRDDAFYGLFVQFLTLLAAAQRGFQNKIMEMLVDLLGPQKTRRLRDCKAVRAPKMHRRTLQAIRYVTASVPAAAAALADRLSAKLEFEFASSAERMPFVRNFMRLIAYVPELTNEIVVCVLRQLIRLDHMSESQMELAAATSSLPGLASGMPSPPTEDDSDSDRDSLASAIEEEERAAALAAESAEQAARRQLKDNIKQVDAIMDVLFAYYASLVSSPDASVRRNAIDQLIVHFHAHILPAYRSRHPQFLVFHFAQSDPEIVDRFITSCIKVLIDRHVSPHTRHAAAAYFAGFVGRGAHVSALVVHDCLDLLIDHLDDLRVKYEPGCRGPDLKRYGDFYAVFQAILYIFCFRWRDIGSPESDDDDDGDDDDDNNNNNNHNNNHNSHNHNSHNHNSHNHNSHNHNSHNQLDELGAANAPNSARPARLHFEDSLRDALHTAIYSPLNPLRVCTPVIVEQFAKLTFALEFFYLFPKLEQNKHVRLANHAHGAAARVSLLDLAVSDAGRDMSWVGDNGILEGYFPYDPYELPLNTENQSSIP